MWSRATGSRRSETPQGAGMTYCGNASMGPSRAHERSICSGNSGTTLWRITGGQGMARGSQAEEIACAKAQSCERLEQSVRWDVSRMSPEGQGKLGQTLTGSPCFFSLYSPFPLSPQHPCTVASNTCFPNKRRPLHLFSTGSNPSAQQTHPLRPSPVKTPLTLGSSLSSEPARRSLGN